MYNLEIPRLYAVLLGCARFAAFVCMLSTWAIGLHAQNDSTIYVIGKVVNSSGEAVPFARVADTLGAAGAYTDDNGRFSFAVQRNPGATSVALRVSQPGYEARVVFVPVKNDTANAGMIMLKDFALASPIVVSEKIALSPAEASLTVESIDPKRLDRMADHTVMSAVELTPGVTIYDEQPSIRGSSGYTFGAGTRVLTLLDGLPMINADLAAAEFDLLPTDNIQSVEVLKGAASVMYGAGAMGGVINVRTKPPALEPTTRLRFRGQIFDAPASPGADWDGRSSANIFSMHAMHSRSFGKEKRYGTTLLVDWIEDSGYRKDEFSKRWRVYWANRYNFIEKEDRQLSAGINAQVSVDSSAQIIAWGGYPDSALIAGDGFITYQFLPRVMLDPYVNYYGKKFDHQYRGRVYWLRNDLSTNQDGESTLIYNQYEFSRKRILLPRIGFVNSLSFTAGLNQQRNIVRTDSAFGNAESDQYAVFAQASARLFNNRLRLTFGARYQYETIIGDTALTPDLKGQLPRHRLETVNRPVFRGGANLRLFRATYLRGSIGQAVRSPSVAERFTSTSAGLLTIVPNHEIGIEEGWSAEIGARQLFRANWSAKSRLAGFVDFAFFTYQFKNLVEIWLAPEYLGVVPGLPFQAQNIAGASVTGGELALGVRQSWESGWRLELEGGATRVEPVDRQGNKELDGDVDLIPGEPDRPYTLKYRNEWLVRTRANIGWKGYSVGANYSYNSHIVNVDKVFLIDLAVPDVAAFRAENNTGWDVLDLVFQADWAPHTVSFHVFNALNEEYMTVPGTIGEQRSYALQWKAEF